MVQSSSPSSPSSAAGLEYSTGYDNRGFLTTYTFTAGYESQSSSYDHQGFLITATPTGTAAATTSAGACFGQNCGANGKVIGISTSTALAAKHTAIWQNFAMLGVGAVLVERLLL